MHSPYSKLKYICQCEQLKCKKYCIEWSRGRAPAMPTTLYCSLFRTLPQTDRNNNKRRSPTKYSQFQRSLCASCACVHVANTTKWTTILERRDEPQTLVCVRVTRTACRVPGIKSLMGGASDFSVCVILCRAHSSFLWHILDGVHVYVEAIHKRVRCVRANSWDCVCLSAVIAAVNWSKAHRCRLFTIHNKRKSHHVRTFFFSVVTQTRE